MLWSNEGKMKYFNVILTVIAIIFIAAVMRLYSWENSLKSLSESNRLIIASNQALINANARLESEVVNLRKEISAIKENFPKK